MATYKFHGHNISTPLTIRSNQPVLESESVSLRLLRTSRAQAQRFEFTFKIVFVGELPDPEPNVASFLADSVTTFTRGDSMICPQVQGVSNFFDKDSTALKNESVPCQVNQAGITTVLLNDSSLTASKVIPKGTLITFSNHRKLYIVTTRYTTGDGSIEIFPMLRKAIAATDHIRHPGRTGVNQPYLNYYQDNTNLNGVTYQDGSIIDPGTIKLIEALD